MDWVTIINTSVGLMSLVLGLLAIVSHRATLKQPVRPPPAPPCASHTARPHRP